MASKRRGVCKPPILTSIETSVGSECVDWMQIGNRLISHLARYKAILWPMRKMNKAVMNHVQQR